MSATLKSCPFCGGEAKYRQDHTTERVDTVSCLHCDFWISDPDDIGSCIAAWNRRADGWQDISTAPTEGHFLAVVDGAVRVVAYGKTSHVPIYGFCLADQGAEDFDLCKPTHWMPLPASPEVPS